MTKNRKCECGGEYYYGIDCGAYVCSACRAHEGLVRCYCGWSRSGGNGRTELIEMGECLDENY